MACRVAGANSVVLLTEPMETNFNEILIEVHIYFYQKAAFENVVCKMAAILPRPQCINF